MNSDSYVCGKCGFTTKYKSSWDRHISNKTQCHDKKIQLQFTCVFCGKIFKYQSLLSKHQTKKCTSCKKIKEEDNETYQNIMSYVKKLDDYHNNELNTLTEKYHDLVEQCKYATISNSIGNENKINNSIINSNNSITNNITINLVEYGKEDHSFISEEQFKKIFKTGYESLLNYTNLLHFNKKHPEFHNIYINNAQNKKVRKFDGDKWIETDKEDFVDDYYCENGDNLIEEYENFVEELSEEIKRKFEKFINNRYEEKVAKQLKKELSEAFYNNRTIVKETIKKNKKN